MRVLFVTSEAYPLAKSGGLADVSSALPIALRGLGADVRLLLPGYPGALMRLKEARIEARLPLILGVEGAALVGGRLPGTEVPVWLLDAPELFDREGLYQDAQGRDWPDNARRFAFLAHAAVALATGELVDWRADVVHANDWHAGLVPFLLAGRGSTKPATVFTAHNLAFQGNFPADVMSAIGLSPSAFGALEFYGQASFLKAALCHADRVSTVSPGYAAEVLTPAFGCGMDGILRGRGDAFVGILNGIDYSVWDPAHDPNLAESYSARDIAGKRICKAALQREMGLTPDPEVPLIGFVSRLTHQKMADVVAAAIPGMVEAGAQFVLVGQGDADLEAAFAQAAQHYDGVVAASLGYDEARAHRLQAGCDILLAPARFEPCGLTQMYAQRYGTVPVVRRVGGLADTVVDATPESLAARTATGFVFEDGTRDALERDISRALTLYREPLAWRRLQLQGMARDFRWQVSALKYLALYHEAARMPVHRYESATHGRDASEGEMKAAG